MYREEIVTKFSLGKIFSSAGVHEMMIRDPSFMQFVNRSLTRHTEGDWGDLCEEDKKENELSLREGFRLFSSYKNDKHKIWIITEADRSVTTVLFPEEY
ncbi:MAG: hypothetical protein AB1390_12175 [Nitrospirota bacterium]